MANYSAQYIFGINADTKKAEQSLNNLQKTLTSIQKQADKNMHIDLKLDQAAKSAEQLQNALAKALNVDTNRLNLTKFNQELKLAGTSIEQLASNLINAGNNGALAFNQLASTIANAEVPLKRMNSTLKNWMTTLKNTVKWEISSSMVHGVESFFNNAITYAQNLNSTLNDIRVVTGQTIDDMSKFTVQANRMAKELSTTTNEFAKASLIYYQQGDAAELAAKKAAITTKAANVAFTASAQEMSQMLTAVWNSYQAGEDQLEHMVDVMAKLGATTASSMEEMSKGMQKVAATANTVGVSMEKMSAMIATSASVTRQAPETIGTAWNTVLSRLGGLKLGETLEDGVDLNKYSKALKTIGVDILDTTGNIRDMGDVIDEIGAKWDTMTKAQKSALAQTVGGARQYTQILAFFENFDKYQKNLATANNSQGALQQQADIYAESWEAATKRQKAALEGVFNTVINDKGIINITNSLTGFIDKINEVIKGVGGLQGALLTLGSVGSAIFSKQLGTGIDKMLIGLTGFGGRIKNSFTMSRDYSKDKTTGMGSDANTRFGRFIDIYRQIGNAETRQTRQNLQQAQQQLLRGAGAPNTDASAAAITNAQKLLNLKQQLLNIESKLSVADQERAQNSLNALGQEQEKLVELIAKYEELDENLNKSAEGHAAALNTLYPSKSISQKEIAQNIKDYGNAAALVHYTSNLYTNQDIISRYGANDNISRGEVLDRVQADVSAIGNLASDTKNEEIIKQAETLKNLYNDLFNTTAPDEFKTKLEAIAQAMQDIGSKADEAATKKEQMFDDKNATSEQAEAIGNMRQDITEAAVAKAQAARRQAMQEIRTNSSEEQAKNALSGSEKHITAVANGIKTVVQSGIMAVSAFNAMSRAMQTLGDEGATVTQKLSAGINVATNLLSAWSQGWVNGLIATAAAAISLVVNSIDAANARAKELRMQSANVATEKSNASKENLEEVQKLNKEYKDLQNAQNTYDTVYLSKLDEIAEALDVESARVLTLTGNYNDLTEAIEKSIKARLKENVAEADKALRTAKQSSAANLEQSFDNYGIDIHDMNYNGIRGNVNLNDFLEVLWNATGLSGIGAEAKATLGASTNYEALAALFGGTKGGAGWLSEQDDLLISSAPEALLELYERLQDIKDTADADGDQLAVLKAAVVNTQQFSKFFSAIEEATAPMRTAIETGRSAKAELYFDQMTEEHGDWSDYGATTREELINGLIEEWESSEQEVDSAGQTLAAQLVDSFLQGISSIAAQASKDSSYASRIKEIAQTYTNLTGQEFNEEWLKDINQDAVINANISDIDFSDQQKFAESLTASGQSYMATNQASIAKTLLSQYYSGQTSDNMLYGAANILTSENLKALGYESAADLIIAYDNGNTQKKVELFAQTMQLLDQGLSGYIEEANNSITILNQQMKNKDWDSEATKFLRTIGQSNTGLQGLFNYIKLAKKIIHVSELNEENFQSYNARDIVDVIGEERLQEVYQDSLNEFGLRLLGSEDQQSAIEQFFNYDTESTSLKEGESFSNLITYLIENGLIQAKEIIDTFFDNTYSYDIQSIREEADEYRQYLTQAESLSNQAKNATGQQDYITTFTAKDKYEQATNRFNTINDLNLDISKLNTEQIVDLAKALHLEDVSEFINSGDLNRMIIQYTALKQEYEQMEKAAKEAEDNGEQIDEVNLKLARRKILTQEISIMTSQLAINESKLNNASFGTEEYNKLYEERISIFNKLIQEYQNLGDEEKKLSTEATKKSLQQSYLSQQKMLIEAAANIQETEWSNIQNAADKVQSTLEKIISDPNAANNLTEKQLVQLRQELENVGYSADEAQARINAITDPTKTKEQRSQAALFASLDAELARLDTYNEKQQEIKALISDYEPNPLPVTTSAEHLQDNIPEKEKIIGDGTVDVEKADASNPKIILLPADGSFGEAGVVKVAIADGSTATIDAKSLANYYFGTDKDGVGKVKVLKADGSQAELSNEDAQALATKVFGEGGVIIIAHAEANTEKTQLTDPGDTLIYEAGTLQLQKADGTKAQLQNLPDGSIVTVYGGQLSLDEAVKGDIDPLNKDGTYKFVVQNGQLILTTATEGEALASNGYTLEDAIISFGSTDKGIKLTKEDKTIDGGIINIATEEVNITVNYLPGEGQELVEPEKEQTVVVHRVSGEQMDSHRTANQEIAKWIGPEAKISDIYSSEKIAETLSNDVIKNLILNIEKLDLNQFKQIMGIIYQNLINVDWSTASQDVKKGFKQYLTLIQQMIQSGSEELQQIGQYLIDGLYIGISSKINNGELWSSVDGLQELLLEIFQTETQEQSPSKLTKKIGEYLILGLAEGITNQIANTDWNSLLTGLGAHIGAAFQAEMEKAKEGKSSLFSAEDFANLEERGQAVYQTAYDAVYDSYGDKASNQIQREAEAAGEAARKAVTEQASKELAAQFEQNWYNGGFWDSKTLNEYQKFLLSQALNKISKDRPELQIGTDEFETALNAELTKSFSTIGNNIEQSYAASHDMIRQFVTAHLQHEEEAAQKTYEAWSKAYTAIAKARQGLLSNVSISDTLYGDIESQAKILQTLMEQLGYTVEQALQIMNNKNFDPSKLHMTDFSGRQEYSQSGNQRFFNWNEAGTYLQHQNVNDATTAFKQNYQNYYRNNLMQGYYDYGKYKGYSKEQLDEALVTYNSLVGKALDERTAKEKQIFNEANQIIHSMLTMLKRNENNTYSVDQDAIMERIMAMIPSDTEIANLFYESMAHVNNDNTIIRQNAEVEANKYIAQNKTDQELLSKARQSLLNGENLELHLTEKEQERLKELTGVQDLTKISLELLDNAASSCASSLSNLATALGQLLGMVNRGEADEVTVDNNGVLHAYKDGQEVSMKDSQTYQDAYYNSLQSNYPEIWQQNYEAAQQIYQEQLLAAQEAARNAVYAPYANNNIIPPQDIERDAYEAANQITTVNGMTVDEYAAQEAAKAIIAAIPEAAEEAKTAGEEAFNNGASDVSASIEDASNGADSADKIQKMEDYAKEVGLTIDEFQELKEELLNTNEALQQLYESGNMTEDELNELAYMSQNAANGFKELMKVSKDVWKTLEDSSQEGTQAFTDGIQQLKSSMAKMFNTDLSKLSDDFVKKHIANMKAMAQGTKEEAIKAQDAIHDDLLKTVAQANKMSNITVKVAQNGVEESVNIIDYLADALDQFDGKEFGFVLNADAEPAIQAINAAMEAAVIAGEMTAEEAAAAITELFESIGYEPKVEMEQIQVPNEEDATGHGEVDGEVTLSVAGSQETGTISGGYDVQAHDEQINTIKVPRITSAKKTFNPGGRPSGGSPSKGGGGGGGGKSQAKTHKRKDPEKEKERYHQIERAISQQNKLLEINNELKSRKYGNSYIESLEQENKQIEKQIDLNKEKYKEAEDYYKKDKARLEEYGATFDEMGNLNYEEYMDKWIEWYNQMADTPMTDEAFEKVEEQYEKATKTAIENYEDSQDKLLETQKEIYSLQNKIAENIKEIILNKIEVELQINDNDIKRLDLLIKRFENTFDKLSDVFGFNIAKLENVLKNLTALSSEEDEKGAATIKLVDGELQNIGGAVKEAMDKANIKSLTDANTYIQQLGMLNGSKMTSSVYIETMQDLYDKLIDQMGEVIDLMDTLKEYYGDTLDKAEEKLSKLTRTLDHYMSMMDKYKEMLDFTELGKHFESTKAILDKQYDLSQKQIAIYRNTLDMLLAQKAELLNPDNYRGEITDQALEDLQEKIEEAESNLVESASSSMEIVKEIYTTTIDQIYDELDKLGSGTADNLEQLKQQWDWWIEEQDVYVDRITQAYEIDKMTRKLELEISNVKTNLYKTELSALKEKIQLQSKNNQLTQFNIDMLNYEIELILAKQALEDARNNKSIVKLTRDTNGNYGYQYTADQEEIAEAEQKYNDVAYEMNQRAEQEYRNLQSQLYSLKVEYAEKSKAIWLDESLTTEQKNQQDKALREHYALMAEDFVKQLNDENGPVAYLGKTQALFSDRFGNENLIDNKLTNENDRNYHQQDQYNFDKLNTVEDIMKWFGENAVSISEKAKEALDTYENDIKLITKNAGLTNLIGTKENPGIIDTYIADANQIANKTSQTINTISEQLNGIIKQIANTIPTNLDEILDANNQLLKDINTSIDIVRKLKDTPLPEETVPIIDATAGDAATGEGVSEEKKKSGTWYRIYDNETGKPLGVVYATDRTSAAEALGLNPSESNVKIFTNTGMTTIQNGQYTEAPGGLEDSGYYKSEEDKVRKQYEDYKAEQARLAEEEKRKLEAEAVEAAASKGADKFVTKVIDASKELLDKVERKISSGLTVFKDLFSGIIQASGIKRATGGTISYTGLAHLDGAPGRPEYVLNQEDTAHMFDVVGAASQLDTDTISNIMGTLRMATATMLTGMNAALPYAENVSNGSNELQQNVHITAEFPNATDHNEIEMAFNDIINMATQYANR